MSETGEALGVLENVADQMGEKSKTFHVDGALDVIGRENKKRGLNHRLTPIEFTNDILMYLRCAKDDAPSTKKDSFTAMNNAAAETSNYSLDRETHPELDPLREHLLEQKKKWEMKMGNNDLTDEEHAIAKRNFTIFNSFTEFLHSPSETEDSVPDAAKPAEKEARILPENQARFPEFKFKPVEADAFVGKLSSRKVTLKTLHEYLTLARKDIYTQRTAVKEDNKALYSAFTAARSFREGNTANSEDIVVMVSNNTVTYAGSAQNAPRNEKGERFLFTNGKGDNGPYSLNTYTALFDTYETRAANIDRGLEVIEKLEHSKNAFIEDTKQGAEDQLSAERIPELHEGHIALLKSAGTDTEAKAERNARLQKISILTQFSSLITERKLGVPKRGIRSFLSHAKNKFGRKSKSDDFTQWDLEFSS